MFRGTTQFNRFLESIEGITPKVLTERLRELEKLGIIKRRIVSEYPIRVEYELTDLGKAFEPVLLAAGAFFNEIYAGSCVQGRKAKIVC
jgi:DNA-binding HxlR family transcriptional regulator